MGNILLNKAVIASGYIYPFTPDRTVNGIISTADRWVCSSPVDSNGNFQPMCLTIHLDTTYWINRWVVSQMGQVGWDESYNLSDYMLQGSTDGINWLDYDIVENNNFSKTDRTLQHGASVSSIRLYISKGLKCNNNFASVVNFEVYSTSPTNNTLSSLVIKDYNSDIPTDPEFSPSINNFNACVGFDVDRVFVFPLAADPNAEVIVDSYYVPPGSSSDAIMLTPGNSKLSTVVVRPVVGNNNTYNLNITRSSSPYLANLSLAYGMYAIPITPQPFDRETFLYTANIPQGITDVWVTATAEDSNALIYINTIGAASGEPCVVSLLNSSTISICVSSKVGEDSKQYTINIAKS